MKKLLTVFLILALVLSFFVACDSDKGGGSGGKKKPTQDEIYAVWEMSDGASAVTYYAFDADAEKVAPTTTVEAIDDMLMQSFVINYLTLGVPLECNISGVNKITENTDGSYSVDLDLVPIAGDDLCFNGTARGTFTYNSYDFTFSFSMDVSADVSPTHSALSLVASGSYFRNSNSVSVTYTRVNLNGIEYDPSYFKYSAVIN